MREYRVLLYLVLCNLFWAGNYVFGKMVVAELTPVQIVVTRSLVAVLVLFPIAHWIEKPDWKQVWREWKLLSAMALLGIVGYTLLLYEALRFTASLNAALINSLNPAMIFLFSMLLLKEKITRLSVVGLVTSLVGVLLVLTKGNLQQILHADYNQGDLLMLVAIMTWTFYSLLGRRAKHIPPMSATAVSVLLAMLMLLPFFLASGFHLPLSRQATVGILYIGIFPSAIALIFWNGSLFKIGASRAGIYLNLIAVFTAIINLFLGIPITAVQIMGGLMVFAGVYLTTQTGKQVQPGTAAVR